MNKDSRTSVTAIFDIGKTNKKFFLFDQSYNVLQKEQITLPAGKDDDGNPCEDLTLLESWIDGRLSAAAKDERIHIEALNFSTYGASFVHLDKKGEAVTPLYNYLKAHPKRLLDKFYNTYGGIEKLSLQTASPPMGMLNSGFQLYWLKEEKPEKFSDIHYSLHFPQYLSYLITGRCLSELTSIGCHTCLWDFEQNAYHHWLKQENLLRLMPPLQAAATTQEAKYKELKVQTGTGIHDSSAALAPFLLALDKPFMLVSTGTWSITLDPFNKEPLTYSELQKDCLCYLDIYGNQVKAARFFLGSEYAFQKDRIKKYFNLRVELNDIEPDQKILKELIQNKAPANKLQLMQAHNTGPHPQEKAGYWRLDSFSSYLEAYHQLMLDLAAIQAESINLAQGATEEDTLIITGGFSNNDFFTRLLASFFPDKNVFTSSLSNASALGAAVVMHDSEPTAGRKHILKKLLTLKKCPPIEQLDLKGYSWK